MEKMPNMENQDNKDDNLVADLDSLIGERVEEAVAKAMASNAPTPDRKDITEDATPVMAHDPVIDANLETRKGFNTFLGGWLQSIYRKDTGRLADFYKGEQRNAVEKDLSWGTTTAGGFTVPDPVLASDFFTAVVDRPRLQDAMQQVTVDGVRGAIPNFSANTTAAIVAENTTVTPNDATFAEADFALDKAVVLTYASQELLKGTAIDMIGETAANQLIAIRRLVENEVTDGSNFSDTLDGTSWTVAQATIGSISWAELKTIYHGLAVEYRGSGARWIMHPTVWENVMSLVDGQSVPLYNRSIGFAPEDLTIFGAPVILNPQAVDTSIWFGDLGRAMAFIQHGQGPQLAVTDIGGNAYADVQVGIRTHMLVDSVTLVNTTIDGDGAAIVEGTGVTG